MGLKVVPGMSINFWPPSGILLATLLLSRRATWIWWTAAAGVAEMLANALWFHSPIPLAFAYFLANAVEAYFATYLILRFVFKGSCSNLTQRLQWPKNSLLFAILAGGVAPTLGAFIIAGIDAAIGKHEFLSAFKLLWLGDGAGMLISAPLVLGVAHFWFRRTAIAPQAVAEFLGTCAVTILMTWYALRGLFPTFYVAVPPLLWAAVRFRLLGAWVILSALVVSVAIFNNVVFISSDPDFLRQRHVSLQVFLVISATSALVVASLAELHQKVLLQVRDLNENLERRIEERASALCHSEQRLRLAVEATQVGIFDYDVASGKQSLNKEALHIWGISTETSPTPETLLKIVHPEDREHIRAVAEACLDPGGPGEFVIDYRICRSDGQLRWLQVSGKTYFEGKGLDKKAVRVVGTMLDISEEKRAQDLIKEKERLLQSIFDTAGVGLTRCSRDLSFVAVNTAYCAIMGLPRDQIEGKPIAQVASEATVRQVLPYIEQVLAGNRVVFEAQLNLPSGLRNLHVVYTPDVDAQGQILGWVSSVLDITDRKITTERLRRMEVERTFSRLMEQSEVSSAEIVSWAPAVLYVYDRRAGTSIFQNRPLSELLGYSPDAAAPFRDHEWRLLMHGEDQDRFSAHRNKLDDLEVGEVAQFEYRLRKPDGSWSWFHSRDVRIGGGSLIVGMASEITDRKEMELSVEAARKAAEEANRAKDNFLAVLSHELRTPLTPVLMSVESLREDPNLPEDYRRQMEMIQRNIELESSLINDLLDLSRVVSGKMLVSKEEVNLNQLINHISETCRPFIQEKELKFEVELPEQTAFVSGDTARLQQIFLNLLRNAAKFTPEGGQIRLGMDFLPGGQVKIEVQDSGIGVAADFKERMFEAFEQGQAGKEHGGLGLGLSIVKQLVELHGGTITVESYLEGAGSTFIVLLPRIVANTEAEESLEARPKPVVSTPAKRLLIVEDNVDTATVLSLQLSQAGYKLKTAYTVASALKLADEELFDLVISDIGLPDASGYELATKLSQQYGIKAIAMSGYGMEEDIRKSREAGFVDHLVKPITISTLRQSIDKALEDRTASVL